MVDVTGALAVDASTGFFKTLASYWSASADGPDVTLGGAARKLPVPDDRNVYTYLGTNAPTAAQSLADIDAAITSANAPTVLGLTTGDPTLANLLAWARGLDVKDDDDPDTDPSAFRHALGDPVHASRRRDLRRCDRHRYETVVYVTTNDGYLHAIDATSNPDGTDASTSGTELWSYIPKEMLPHLRLLYADATPPSTTGWTARSRALKYDINGDGTINGNDRVILYFGTGRNADTSAYYALDVTDKVNPQLLWKVDAAELAGPRPGLVDAEDRPRQHQRRDAELPAPGAGYRRRLRRHGGQRLVYAADTVGNHIYMVDAISGNLLWSAGASGANFQQRQHDARDPEPGHGARHRRRRLCRSHVRGRHGGAAVALRHHQRQHGGGLVAGGVIASLGDKEEATPPPSHTNTRRFYAAPDVALIQQVGPGRSSTSRSVRDTAVIR